MGSCMSTEDQNEKLLDAERHFREGQQHTYYQRYDEAIDSFNKAVTLNPKHYRALVALGSKLYLNGQNEEAIKCFQTVLAKDHNNIRAKYGITIIKHNGEISQAFLAEMKKITKLDAKTFDDYIGKASAYNKLDNTKKEIAMIQEALKIEEDPEESYLLGHIFFDQEDWPNAIIAFRNAVTWDNGYYPAWDMLGSAYMYSGNYHNAIVNYNKALIMSPNDPSIHAALGQALYWNGAEDKAIEEFDKAFKLYNNTEYSKNLSQDAREYIEEVFSHDRAALLEKFKELSAKPIEIVDTPSFAIEKSVDVQISLDANELRKEWLNKSVKNFDLQYDKEVPPIFEIPEIQYSAYIKIYNMVRRDGLLTKIKSEKETYYYDDAFRYVLGAAYTTAQVTSAGKHAIDTSNVFVTAGTTLISATSIPGADIISSTIQTVYNMQKSADIKKSAVHLSSVATTSIEFNELILQISTKIILDQNKYNKIKNIALNYHEDAGIITKFIDAVQDWGESLVSKLHGNRYKTLEAKMGRDDALRLITAIEKGYIEKNFEFGNDDNFVQQCVEFVLMGDSIDHA